MKTLYFEQIQHPVGQGGFHTGAVGIGSYPRKASEEPIKRLLSWAYDCGSNQMGALRWEIDKTHDRTFDLLFLSHLDDDHVNGVDLLASFPRVKEVVLPYLSDVGWAAHLAAGISSASLSTNFIELASNPALWFGQRGVKKISYVESGPDDTKSLMPPMLPDPTPLGAVEFSPEDVTFNWTDETPFEEQEQDGSAHSQQSLVRYGAIGTLGMGSSILDWVLSPFAYSPSQRKMNAFAARLKKEFGKGLTSKDYADLARTWNGRKKLRKCYDVVWKSHNLHSMALYSGPATNTFKSLNCTSWYGKFCWRNSHPGWVSTGDYHASGKRRREGLIKFYSSFSDYVGQLTLPHHGADASFHKDLLEAFPSLKTAIAPSGPNSYGHPGQKVQREIAKMANVEFAQVGLSPSGGYSVCGKAVP